MKFLLLISILFLNPLHQDSIDPNTQRVLDALIAMQNDGSDESINEFIDEFFHPDLMREMTNKSAHVAFYRQIIDEFGNVESNIYKVEESTSTKLKVQLIKKGIAFIPEPSPNQILVVEIDLHKEETKYLARGLGMGALICYIKR